jgi:hypothetical protein
MKQIFQSTFYQQAEEYGYTPDDYVLEGGVFKFPHKSFVLCRDANGHATATYGELEWDFYPINTSGASSKLNFDFLKNQDVLASDAAYLIEEIKKILFLIIYFSNAGKTGTLSVKTITNRFHSLQKVTLYCINSGNAISNSPVFIRDVLSNEILLADHTRELSENSQSELSNLIANIKRVKTSNTGFEVADYNKARPDADQTPVIPSRIYFLSFEKLAERVDSCHLVKDKLCNLIKAFKNEHVGLALSTQKGRNFDETYPTLQELLKTHKLESFFSGDYEVNDKRNLVAAISDIQLSCKTLIHQFTAMRSGEALRIKCNCIEQVNLSKNKKTQSKLKLNRFVKVISTTSKFTGYMHEAGWLCPQKVTVVVEVLKAIVEGMAHLFDVLPEEIPLFQSAQKITNKKAKKGQLSKFLGKKAICLEGISITASDREELLNTDKSRKFDNPQFQIGHDWLFASHQFRRSLAFYGANSNLVSESTGAQLFKHLNHEMQRYYRKGFNNIRTILGYLDSESGEIKLPDDHFLFEFQTGISTNQAREILQLLLDDNEEHWGKKGSYIEKHRKERGLKSDDVYILDLKSETERQTNEGEISYKKTLLGGCLKVDKCNSFMLGTFTSCIKCEEADIQPAKLNNLIENMQQEVLSYKEESAEYQLVDNELSDLVTFRDRELKKREFV